MIRIKICGMTNLEDACCAVEEGADALGFIFYSGSPRYVLPIEASKIVSKLPPFITPVGVFVNESRERIKAIVESVGLQAVQLHGNEVPEACLGYSVPVIRALRVGKRFDQNRLKAYSVDTFLLDAEKEGFYGGTGKKFNWNLIQEIKISGRVILAGGIDPENVIEAIRIVRPYAVDVSSGVEIEPGRKDPKKLADFFQAVRSVGS